MMLNIGRCGYAIADALVFDCSTAGASSARNVAFGWMKYAFNSMTHNVKVRGAALLRRPP